MLLLILDSSTERGLVAISQEGEVIFERQLPFGYNNSQYILPSVDEGLKLCGLELRGFDGIVVGVGPGSYTGIRVGAAVAKSLSFASGVPLVGICSLRAFVPDSEGLFASIIDAKMGGAYLLSGERTSNGVTFSSDPGVHPLNEVRNNLSSCTRLLTPHSRRLRMELERLYPETPFEWEEVAPSARQYALLAREEITKGKASNDCHLSLMYLRKTQAEIEKEAKTLGSRQNAT